MGGYPPIWGMGLKVGESHAISGGDSTPKGSEGSSMAVSEEWLGAVRAGDTSWGGKHITETTLATSQ